MVEGTVTRKLELPHGPHAIIKTQRAIYVVPWQSVHEQHWGRSILGRVRGGGGSIGKWAQTRFEIGR